MPLHDYRCYSCDLILRDVVVPIALGARAGAPDCPRCEVALPMAWIPAIGSMSVFGVFEKFTTPIEDPSSPTGYRDVEIDSLATIRRLERESEQAERNGEGRRMVWRDFSQDGSNRDQHTLGVDPSMKPAKYYTNGEPVQVRKGDPVIADHGTVED